MRKLVVTAVMLLVATAAMAQLFGGDKKDKDAPQTRTLQGTVSSNSEAPLGDAVVYLKNTKTLLIKTFITPQNGNYRFNALSPNVDYEVYAEYQGAKSGVKTLSSFDSRREAYINLKVDVAKK